MHEARSCSYWQPREGAGEEGEMAWTPPKPAATYDTLLKQFRALCTLHAAVEAELRTYQDANRREMKARAQLYSERAANQFLTNQIDGLLEEIDRLRSTLAPAAPREGAGEGEGG